MTDENLEKKIADVTGRMANAECEIGEFRDWLRGVDRERGERELFAEAISDDAENTDNSESDRDLLPFRSLSNEIDQSDPRLRAITGQDWFVAVLAGLAGALTSAGIKGPANDVHDGKYMENVGGWLGGKDFAAKLRGRVPLDQVPGHDGYGGYWHRLKYGHDILNPMESWSRMRDHFGGPISAAAAYLIHWSGDCLSSEGLPIPGSSIARDLVKRLSRGNYQNYKELFTIKGRDLIGGGLVSALLYSYSRVSWGCGASDSYRKLQTGVLAHGVAAGAGLTIGSLNWYSLVAMGINVGKLVRHAGVMSSELDYRAHELLQRAETGDDLGLPFAAMLVGLEGWDAAEMSDLAAAETAFEHECRSASDHLRSGGDI